jgi:outer membrane protein OmpA-like peptidoglycan-associated protein
MNTVKSIATTAALVLSCAAGCVSPVEPAQSGAAPKLPPPDPDNQYRVVFPDLGRGVARYIRITIGDDLSKSCGLMQSHFEFDSSEPLPQDKIALLLVAECANRPELSRAELSIVGRADSRGDYEYNKELGQRRADRVKELLIEAGVNARRIHTSSSGEMGAVGSNGLYSYGYDRRVDMVLIGMAHAPR